MSPAPDATVERRQFAARGCRYDGVVRACGGGDGDRWCIGSAGKSPIEGPGEGDVGVTGTTGSARGKGGKAVARAGEPAAPAEAAIGVHARFPIVGIGASAGGLEAFEQFFRALPADSGMAFVLVQHLDPSHASILTEILQRSTDDAGGRGAGPDGRRARPRLCHSAQPRHGHLPRRPAAERAGPSRAASACRSTPSCARWPRTRARTPSASSSPAPAPTAPWGCAPSSAPAACRLVQDPATAKYDGMPDSAIQAGYATQVLPRRADAAGAARRHPAAADPPGRRPSASPATGGLGRILMLLRSATGHDFSQYKKSTIGRRIERRMAQHDIEDAEVYARYLQEHPAELQVLFRELLINVTSFFRDPEAFVALKPEVLPALLAGQARGLRAARLGGRLRHRRGGLFDRHAAARADGRGAARLQGAALQHRPRRRCHRHRARRPVPAQHRRRT